MFFLDGERLSSMPDPDEFLYETINKGLLRERRTGSFCTKKMNKTGSFVSFDELPDYEFDPDDFFGPASLIGSNTDNDGESRERADSKIGSGMSNVNRSLSERERDELLAKHLEVIRVQSYEEINEHRERRRLQPWYILTKEELGLVGLCIPYSLSIHRYRRHVKAMIKQEGQRIKDLQARGIVPKPWSTWKEDD